MRSQITMMPDKLKKQFVNKCLKLNVTQKAVILELVNLWIKNKTRIPGE